MKALSSVTNKISGKANFFSLYKENISPMCILRSPKLSIYDKNTHINFGDKHKAQHIYTSIYRW